MGAWRAGTSRSLSADRDAPGFPLAALIQRPGNDDVDRGPLVLERVEPPSPLQDHRKEGDRRGHDDDHEERLLVDDPGREETIETEPEHSHRRGDEKAEGRSITAPRRLRTEAPKRFHGAPPGDAVGSRCVNDL
jgi:hypothetical protein